jgi:hypothetical protein
VPPPARLVVLYGGTWPSPATLDPRTAASVRRFAPLHGLVPEWVDTSASLDLYADALQERWDSPGRLIVVEQDKELHATCLPSLLACGALWCSYTSWVHPVPHTTLSLGSFGVTAFSESVRQMVSVNDFRGHGQPGIDRRFGDFLRLAYGEGCCLHGHVVHHHVYAPRPVQVREHAEALVRAGLSPPPVYPPPPGPHLLPGSYDLPGSGG